MIYDLRSAVVGGYVCCATLPATLRPLFMHDALARELLRLRAAEV